MTSSKLVELASQLSHYREVSSQAYEKALELEREIIKATGFAKPEGQETYQGNGDLGSCRVVLKQPIYTKVDSEAWRKLRRTLPPKHPGRKVFREKFEVIAKAARTLQDKDKQKWADVSSVVTRTPGKVSVEIKNLELGGTNGSQSEVDR